ncbi:MAG: hypothetical protein JWR63_4469 [Conexibacter sp.]|nr:hypothetical protein [Conexibacter sp.]
MSSRKEARVREQIVHTIVQRRLEKGHLSRAEVANAADAAGVDPRTMWRWIEKGTSKRKRRERYELSLDDRFQYSEMNGSVARVVEARGLAGTPCVSESTLRRAVAADLNSADRAFAKSGERGRRQKRAYVRWEAEYVNQIWHADHKELDILVLAPDEKSVLKPWWTPFLEAKSRRIMSASISLRPTSADVLAALHAGIVPDLDDERFGGVPDVLSWDNGMEFAAAAVTEVCAAVDTMPRHIKAYSPWLNGKSGAREPHGQGRPPRDAAVLHRGPTQRSE